SAARGCGLLSVALDDQAPAQGRQDQLRRTPRQRAKRADTSHSPGRVARSPGTQTARTAATAHQSGGVLRSALRLAFAFLSVSRRSIAPRDGTVGRRVRGGGAKAPRNNAASRVAAASRLRSCDRCSDAATTRTPSVSRSPSRDSARSRRNGGIGGLGATGDDRSTL